MKSKHTSGHDLKHNIMHLLSLEPECVESYTRLTVRYWAVIENALTIDEAVFCTSPESICRAFRKMVADGDITLPEDIAESRKKRYEQMTIEYSPGSQETFTSLSVPE